MAAVRSEGNPALKPTPGTITGTKIILLRGGPPEWDGEITGISKGAGTELQRLDHTARLHLRYRRTEELQTVEIPRHQRGGTVLQSKQAEVWECLGYTDEEDQ